MPKVSRFIIFLLFPVTVSEFIDYFHILKYIKGRDTKDLWCIKDPHLICFTKLLWLKFWSGWKPRPARRRRNLRGERREERRRSRARSTGDGRRWSSDGQANRTSKAEMIIVYILKPMRVSINVQLVTRLYYYFSSVLTFLKSDCSRGFRLVVVFNLGS